MVEVYAAVVSAGCAKLITPALINYSLFTGVSCKTTRSSIHHSSQYLHGGPPDPDVVIRAAAVARGLKKRMLYRRKLVLYFMVSPWFPFRYVSIRRLVSEERVLVEKGGIIIIRSV